MDVHPIDQIHDPWAIDRRSEAVGAGRRLLISSLSPPAAGVLLWYLTGRTGLALGGLAVGSVLAVAHRRWPERFARMDRAMAGAVRLTGAAVLFIVALVALYLPGLVAGVLERVGRRRRRHSYWVARSVSGTSERRGAGRPFAPTEQAVRLRRHVVGLTGLVAVLAIGLVAVDDGPGADPDLSNSGDIFERGRRVRFSELAAFEGLSFADALKEEQDEFSNQHLVYSEVGGYDVGDFAGRYTNVVSGVRRTLRPPPCEECSQAVVWIAGGSAAFGLGQRDDHTIASQLVRIAAAEGWALDVVNMGVPGWTIYQEAQKVKARLGAAPAPDLVVFHDGYNDVIGTIIDSTVNGLRPDAPALMDGDDIRQFTEAGLDPWRVGDPEELGELAAIKFDRVRRQIGEFLAEASIPVLHVFQPDALASDSQYRHVEQIYEVGERLRAHFDRALEAASTRLAPEVVNLRHLLDREPPVFADLVHTNEAGARAVAEKMWPLVRARLQARGG